MRSYRYFSNNDGYKTQQIHPPHFPHNHNQPTNSMQINKMEEG